ncbi:hypothetical protein FRC14_008193 [Serendipita sp. 396]|nr:hypothetical protein FRC14_008193 [Serendipita sp. 396]
MADINALKFLAIKLQNVSDSRSKIHCLEQISKRCNVLKQTLTSRGLEDHSSSMEDETGRDRINDLPDELLVDIFKLHIRRWRNLVDSVPSLWNWVQAIPHSSLRNLDTCKKMVDHCLERSGKMPLDLTLDFRLLWDAKNYPDRLVEPYLSSEPDCDDLWKISDKIREESILSYIDYTSSLQSAFAGWPYACYADRWRSFRIFFSDWMNDMDVSRLLGSFAYPDPSLDTLETLEIVHGLPGSDSFSGVEQAIYENRSFRFPAAKGPCDRCLFQ